MSIKQNSHDFSIPYIDLWNMHKLVNFKQSLQNTFDIIDFVRFSANIKKDKETGVNDCKLMIKDIEPTDYNT